MSMKVMYKFLLTLLFAVLTASVGIAGSGPGGGPGGGNGPGPGSGDQPGDGPGYELIPLSVDEETGLLYTREEEKLARDAYVTFAEKHGLLVFTNIARSEQKHMDAVKRLLDKYELTDPVAVEEDVGTFSNSSLQSMYNGFVSEGMVSDVAALYVGAEIEELDIYDLQIALLEANPDHADLVLLYEYLLCGARNHLRAFIGLIEAQGVAYDEPAYLTIDEISDIVDQPMERKCGFNKGESAGKGPCHREHGDGPGG